MTEINNKLIAFYLPQYHRIPENDRWWGEGFTEWTGVYPATPQFIGHKQPNIPLYGPYDLSDPNSIRSQVRTAKNYNIYGFCLYYYWFSGRRLLEKPLDIFMQIESEFPFCVCWANENWTRRWDGRENDVLMAQSYTDADMDNFIRDVIPILQRPNYITVNGKKMLLVYRSELIPDPQKWTDHWRSVAMNHGIDLHLVRAESFTCDDPRSHGFDASYEFPPLFYARNDITEQMAPSTRMKVYEYASMVRWGHERRPTSYPLYAGVCPSWDNTPRRGNRAHIMHGSTPDLFKAWLKKAFSRTSDGIVFCNAWNEWGEGAYLEPDERSGFDYLRACSDVIMSK